MLVNTIMGLLADSPLKPLQTHSKEVYQCCLLLIPFFKDILANRWEQAQCIQGQIITIERQANALKREICLKLPTNLFLPVDRTDLLQLVKQQDRLANRAKDISGRMIGRRLQIPCTMQSAFVDYVKRCLDAAWQANQVINELDELLETGFRGREVILVEGMVLELNKIEDDTDQLQIALRRELMQLESQYNPIDVMFLYQILEWLGGLADQALGIGTYLELMLARS